MLRQSSRRYIYIVEKLRGTKSTPFQSLNDILGRKTNKLVFIWSFPRAKAAPGISKNTAYVVLACPRSIVLVTASSIRSRS